MSRHIALHVLVLCSALSLAACHLYFEEGEPGEGSQGDCREADCDPAPFSWPDAGPPSLDFTDAAVGGGACQIDLECGPGCFCNADGLCEEGERPTFACGDLDEQDCIASQSCTPVYSGIDCTAPDGSTCAGEASNCSCESFIFASCLDA